MSDYVNLKFPDLVEAIQALKNNNSAFSEMCTDYEEMCTWLDNYCRSEVQQSEECYSAREIIWDLEDEIAKVLRDAGFYPP